MSSPIVRLLRDYCCQDLLESSPIFFFLSIRSRFPRRPCLSNEDSNEDESIRFPRFLIFEREKWRPLVKNHPRKRICVSIYIRRRPLLRGDEFNRCIPFARLSQVDPGNRDNASPSLSTVSPWNFLEFCRTTISFDRRRAFSFLLFFSFPFFFFYLFFTHTVTPLAPFHFTFASRTIPHSKYRSRPFSTDPRSPPLPTPPSSRLGNLATL